LDKVVELVILFLHCVHISLLGMLVWLSLIVLVLWVEFVNEVVEELLTVAEEDDEDGVVGKL
jgi:diacylglycerol kinase